MRALSGACSGAAAVALLVALLAACGGSAPPPRTTPGGPEACAIDKPAAILIVSQPEAAQLALAKHESLAVAAYDCNGLRILSNCTAPSRYAVFPVEPS